MKGATVATPESISEMLAKLANEKRAEFEVAASQQDGPTAISALTTSHVWRAISLAVTLDLCPTALPWRENAAVIGAEALRYVRRSITGLAPDDEPSSHFRKATFIRDVLMNVLSLKAIAEGTDISRGRGVYAALLLAIDLGECGAMLELAHAGHWDEVARLRDRRVGRPKGTTGSAWTNELRPQIQAWIDENPTRRQADLVKATHALLKDWSPPRDGNKPAPQEDSSVRRALTKLKKAGLIEVPPTFRWGK